MIIKNLVSSSTFDSCDVFVSGAAGVFERPRDPRKVVHIRFPQIHLELLKLEEAGHLFQRTAGDVTCASTAVLEVNPQIEFPVAL